jgi:tetratricopeptide (TPR) repeat protein
MRMKPLFFEHPRAFPALIVVVFILSLCAQTTAASRPIQENGKPKVSPEEAKALAAINSAPDAAAKLAAAESFVKTYPKSNARLGVANYVAGQIGQVIDAAQRLSLAEKFQKIFTEEKELNAVRPVILDAYVAANRVDEAFDLASKMLAKNPEDLRVLIQMMNAGAEAAKHQNGKYAAQSLQYGLQAIELIEANKKPVELDDASWERQKTVLPRLYSEAAILSLLSGNSAAAKTRLEKAATLDPNDPMNQVLIASILDEEYQKLAQTYQQMPASQQKDDMLKKINEQLDKTIDAYAHAVGLSMGRPEYQQLQDQALQSVTPYYKYRHNQSTEGLQPLIDKYKVMTKP